MQQQPALILFAHGARDSRWAAPFQRLQQIVKERLQDTPVELAFLELMPPSLPDVIQKMQQAGYINITIVPVFFGQGGHVLRDLPVMLEQLQKQYPGMTLKSASAVGENEEVLNAIANYCIDTLSTP